MNNISNILLVVFISFLGLNNGFCQDSLFRSTYLKTNKKELLPFKTGVKYNAAILLFGFKPNTEFAKTLNQFDSIPIFEIPNKTDLVGSLPLFESISRYNTLIIAYKNGFQPDLTLHTFFKSLIGKKIVMVHFDNPNEEDFLTSFIDSDALIKTYDSSEDNQNYLAQMLFGVNGLERIKVIEEDTSFYSLPLFKNYRLGYGDLKKSGIHPSFESKVEKIVAEAIQENAFPGCQILVAKGGKIVFNKAYGYHTYKEETKVTTKNYYDLASITKITGTLPVLMELVTNGKIDLDDPISMYYKQWRWKRDKKDITFRQALSHNAGFIPGISYWKKAKPKLSAKKSDFLVAPNLYLDSKIKKKYLKTLKKTTIKNTGPKYSGIPYFIFPEVIAKHVYEEDYLEHWENRIANKLDADIYYLPLRFMSKDNIIPTENDDYFRNQQLQGTVHDENAAILGGVSGNAGIFSNAENLAKLMQMYLNRGIYGGHRFFSPDVFDEFNKRHYAEDGSRYGLGFDKPMIYFDEELSMVAESASASSFGHGGYTGTMVWADPKSDLIFIFLSNRVYPTRENRNLYTLNIRPRLHQALYDSIEKQIREDVLNQRKKD